MWQDVIAVAAAILAAGYLGRRLLRPRSACGPACHRCQAASSAQQPLVQLQSPAEKKPQESVSAAKE